LIRFILYSRSYCHLCDDMLDALKGLIGEQTYPIDVRDVDADPVLLTLYDELVPVLVGVRENQPPRQLCHYFLNENKVRDFLAGRDR